ncbi:NADH pyrophosphatase [Bacteroidales bacterium Barb6]|nr:NADH pyrophosphatase [Bacteroidales bacterium Barb6]
MVHPLDKFACCPVCGMNTFVERNEKAKHCVSCGFVYYFNPSAAVACFIKNPQGELLVVRRGNPPEANTLDLPGGFVDMAETAEAAVCREIKEETNLDVIGCRYLFSLPNIYPYSGFDVHTLDFFFECETVGFASARAGDDASEIIILRPADLEPEAFGLTSVREAVARYKESN